MVKPTFSDYVDLLCTLFERFWQHHSTRPHRGHPFIYEQKALIMFFVVMQQRRIFRFKAQHRWLQRHPETRQVFGLDTVPHRSTLSRLWSAIIGVPCRKRVSAWTGQVALRAQPLWTMGLPSGIRAKDDNLLSLGATFAMTRYPRRLHYLMRFDGFLLTLMCDAGRFLLLCLRPNPGLAAANLCLRKQLALYQEHHTPAYHQRHPSCLGLARALV